MTDVIINIEETDVVVTVAESAPVVLELAGVGVPGPRGKQGEKGDGLKIDATGLLSERSIHDAETTDFSFYASDTGELYFKLSDTVADWSNGSFIKGEDGTDGLPGDSAYQIWMALGNTGTETDFINSLKGDDGNPGSNGNDGVDGLSAYEVWRALGNTGTEADFIGSLKGGPGQNGSDGLSAYEIWKLQGNTGTEADFIASLNGDDGDPGSNGSDGNDGESAYQAWLSLGNSGTKQDFINSLKGETGDIPAHNWSGTSISFQNPDGTPGPLIDLKGEKGGDGEPGADGEQLPDKTGNSGRLLGTDGTTAFWQDPPVALPDQNGHDGKVLSTDGTTASWESVATGVPVGTFLPLGRKATTMGYLAADGEQYNKADHPALWQVAYDEGWEGVTDTTFIVPDLRGLGVTGYDPTGIVDPDNVGRGILTKQEDASRNITATLDLHSTATPDATGAIRYTSAANTNAINGSNPSLGRMDFDSSRVVPTAAVNRINNFNALWVVKAYDVIQNPAQLQAQAVVDAVNANSAWINNHSEAVTNPNLLINGDFSVAQRGVNTTTSAEFLRDRWLFSISASSTLTVNVEDGGTYGKTVVWSWLGTASTATKSFEQRIEDVRAIRGNVTFSFKASREAGNDPVEVLLIQNFGPSGSDEIQTPAQTLNLTADMENVALNFSLPATDGKTINEGSYVAVVIRSTGTVTSTSRFAEMKLEHGPTASPFFPDDPATNLAKCQRYYQKVQNTNGTAKSGYITNVAGVDQQDVIYLSVAMRTAPTGTFSYTSASSRITDILVARTGPTYLQLNMMVSSTGYYQIVNWSYTADAEL